MSAVDPPSDNAEPGPGSAVAPSPPISTNNVLSNNDLTSNAPSGTEPRMAALPSPFLDHQHAMPQRPNLGSMLFLTAFFFFMSGNNNANLQTIPVVGPDGTMQPRYTTLDRARNELESYKGWVNGSLSESWDNGTWADPASLLPDRYRHDPQHHVFPKNVTGFIRHATAYVLETNSTSLGGNRPVFDASSFSIVADNIGSGVSNSTERNAWGVRRIVDWPAINRADLSLKERFIAIPQTNSSTSHPSSHITENDNYFQDWSWIKGSLSLSSNTSSSSEDYELAGLHFKPNGTFGLYAVPSGGYLDIRNISRLYPGDAEKKIVQRIVLAELASELSRVDETLFLQDIPLSEATGPLHPIFMHLALPPVPSLQAAHAAEKYEQELNDPKGIRWSLPDPAQSWSKTPGLGASMHVYGQDIVLGMEGGRPLRLTDFWRQTVNCESHSLCFQAELPMQIF